MGLVPWQKRSKRDPPPFLYTHCMSINQERASLHSQSSQPASSVSISHPVYRILLQQPERSIHKKHQEYLMVKTRSSKTEEQLTKLNVCYNSQEYCTPTALSTFQRNKRFAPQPRELQNQSFTCSFPKYLLSTHRVPHLFAELGTHRCTNKMHDLRKIVLLEFRIPKCVF